MALEEQYQELLIEVRQAGGGHNGRSQQRAQTAATHTNHQGYKKFLDAVSKLFLVESPVCALVAEGQLLQDNIGISLQAIHVAFNNHVVTHGIIKLDTLSNALTHVALDHAQEVLGAGVFCYSRIAHNCATMINDIITVMRRCEKLIQENIDVPAVHLPEAQNTILLIQNLNRVLQVVARRITQISRNPEHQNSVSWNADVIDNTIAALPKMDRFLSNLRQDDDILQYLQRVEPNTHSKLQTALHHYDEYKYCTEFVIEFARNFVEIPDPD